MTALVCGIVGSVFGLIPILGLIALTLGVIALVFGLLAARKAKQQQQPRGMARAGWILGVVAIVLGVVGMAIVSDAFEDLENDLDELEQELNEP